MDHLNEFQKLGLVDNEDEVTLQDRGLRILGRMIARRLIKNRRDSKNDDNTTGDQRIGPNDDEDLLRI